MENTSNPDVINTGSVNISDEVVSTIASLAASGINGVVGMVSSISGGFAELLGKKNLSKGVKVSVNERKATLDLAIIVEYGAKIPDVAWEIQEKVKSEVEAMTGLDVVAVNVSVEGVNVPKETKLAAEETTASQDPAQSISEELQESAACDTIEEEAEQEGEDTSSEE